jgi:hypothetical protein
VRTLLQKNKLKFRAGSSKPKPCGSNGTETMESSRGELVPKKKKNRRDLAHHSVKANNTKSNAKYNFSIEIYEDQFMEVTVLPPSFDWK